LISAPRSGQRSKAELKKHRFKGQSHTRIGLRGQSDSASAARAVNAACNTARARFDRIESASLFPLVPAKAGTQMQHTEAAE